MTHPQPRIELAIGADLDADPSTWAWTDVSLGYQFLAQTLILQRGRADDASATDPKTVSFMLDNPDGALTPEHPLSPHYPHVVRGIPCRISQPGVASTTWLELFGTAYDVTSTPDVAALDITGDIDIRFDVDAIRHYYTGSGTVIIAAKATWPSEISWYLTLTAGRIIGFHWTTGGTSATLRSLVATTAMNPAKRAGRVTLDVNNGSGGHTATFYEANTLTASYTQVGTAVPGSGTTSIFASAQPVTIGGEATLGAGAAELPTGTPAYMLAGRVYGLQVRNGIGGSIVANPDFTGLEPGTRTLTDSAGRVWTIPALPWIAPELRFMGQVDEIHPIWPWGGVGESRVQIVASGTLRRLQQGAKPFQSALRRRIGSKLTDGHIYAYWPCEDSSEATVFYSPVQGVPPARFRSSVMPSRDDTLRGSESLPHVDSGTEIWWHGNVPRTAPLLGTWVVEFAVRVPAVTATYLPIMVIQPKGGGVAKWFIEVNNANLRARAIDADGNSLANEAAAVGSEFYAQWVIVRFSNRMSGPNLQWDLRWDPLDGIFAGWNLQSFINLTSTGGVRRFSDVAIAPSQGFSFGHIVHHDGQDMPAGWLNDAGMAWIRETAAHRFWRLCHEEEIPVAISGDVSLERYPGLGNPQLSRPMGPQGTATLLDLLNECAEVDRGHIFELPGSLGLGYRCASSLHNQIVSVSLDASENEIEHPFDPALDDQRIRNDINLTRPNGATYRLTTDPPPPPSDRYETEYDINIPDDGQLADEAGWRLHLGTWPGMRYPAVTSDLDTAPQILPDWLAAHEGDRVQVTGLPTQHPPNPVDMLIEGLVETISPATWTISANCSPAGPWEVGIRDDNARGKRDTAGAELAAQFVAGTATAMSVATTKGPLWTTAAADMPFEIDVGGVRLRVTAVSGSTSPQTFTVVQTPINGITKTIPVATPVRLWRPTVRAR